MFKEDKFLVGDSQVSIHCPGAVDVQPSVWVPLFFSQKAPEPPLMCKLDPVSERVSVAVCCSSAPQDLDWCSAFPSMPLSEQLRHYEQLVELIRQAHAAHAAAVAAGQSTTEVEVPDDFLDPITMVLMTDPVKLPDSQIIVDRCEHGWAHGGRGGGAGKQGGNERGATVLSARVFGAWERGVGRIVKGCAS